MKELKLSSDTQELITIATGYALKMGDTVLQPEHITYIVWKRPDLFLNIPFDILCFHNLYERFSPDKLSVSSFGSSSQDEKIIWSKDLQDSVSIALEKTSVMGAQEITPKFLLYGILKNKNTRSNKLFIERAPCGNLTLTKVLEGYFWGVIPKEHELYINACLIFSKCVLACLFVWPMISTNFF
ncbi:MAG: hypothetical protein V2A78_13275 [bacterium]